MILSILSADHSFDRLLKASVSKLLKILHSLLSFLTMLQFSYEGACYFQRILSFTSHALAIPLIRVGSLVGRSRRA